MLQWAFRNRQTGKITIAQVPNLPLAIFIVATVLRLVVQPSGGAGTAFTIVTTAALAWWGADEVLRGVNPWRRFLGAGVLAWIAVRLLTR